MNKRYQVGTARFAATVRKYDVNVTANISTAIAISQGLFYGLSSGVAILATNLAGAYIAAIGFAVTDMTLAVAGQGKPIALCDRGIVDFAAANITGGALTAGAPFYLSTAGMVTPTRPTANGTLIQPLGIALSTTRGRIIVQTPSAKAQTSGNSDLGGL